MLCPLPAGAGAAHRKLYFTGGGLNRELRSEIHIQINTKYAKSQVKPYDFIIL